MNEMEIEVDKELEEKKLKAVEEPYKMHEHDTKYFPKNKKETNKKPDLKLAKLLNIEFLTTEKGAELLNEISRIFDLVDVKQKDSKAELQNAENIIRNTVETKDLTFLDGVLVTWEIFNKILDKRLRDDNGDPEGIIYKGRKYDYLGIIDDDVNDLLLNNVLEHGYFKSRGKYLCDLFENSS